MDVQEFQPARQLHRGRRGVLILLLAVSSVATLGSGLLSLALFTDSDASTGGFTTGSIDINSNPAVLFTVPAMYPGDTVTADLAVTNDGPGDLRYAMTTAATDDGLGLAGQLELSVNEGTCATPGAAVLTSVVLGTASFGDPTAGGDPGDRTILAVGPDDSFCFSVHLPNGTGPSFMGATTTATFTFDAEQTANNP